MVYISYKKAKHKYYCYQKDRQTIKTLKQENDKLKEEIKLMTINETNSLLKIKHLNKLVDWLSNNLEYYDLVDNNLKLLNNRVLTFS